MLTSASNTLLLHGAPLQSLHYEKAIWYTPHDAMTSEKSTHLAQIVMKAHWAPGMTYFN